MALLRDRSQHNERSQYLVAYVAMSMVVAAVVFAGTVWSGRATSATDPVQHFSILGVNLTKTTRTEHLDRSSLSLSILGPSGVFVFVVPAVVLAGLYVGRRVRSHE